MKRHIKQPQSLLDSIRCALVGIGHAMYSQRNLKIHSIATLIVISLGLATSLSPIEWCVLLLCAMSVICLEMVNTAFELVVDLSTKEKKIRAKLCKDTAAGAVLIASIVSVLCGGLIFYKRFVTLIIGGL